jgi:hypothetical protein
MFIFARVSRKLSRINNECCPIGGITVPTQSSPIAFTVLFVCSASTWVFAGEMQQRLTPDEIAALPSLDARTGTSGVAGIRTTVLSGDPSKAGLYTIRLFIPSHTVIKPHHHRDDRVATVVSGFGISATGSNATRQRSSRCRPEAFIRSPLVRRISPVRKIRRLSSTSPALGRVTPFTSKPATTPGPSIRGAKPPPSNER